MKIIDTHLNISQDGKWFNTTHDASLSTLIKGLDEAGTEKGVLISTPTATSNDYVESVLNKYPDRFRAMASLDFNQSDLEAQTRSLIAKGFSGIKIHPRIQGVDLCDEKYLPLWDYFNKEELTIHVDGYFQLMNHNVRISDLYPLNYENHLRKFPQVTFILGHAGFHRVLDCFFMARSYPNFYCNISYSINYIKRTSLYKDYRFFLEMCDQKILFASDFPETSTQTALDLFLELANGMDAEKKENILFNNAQKIFWQ